MLWARVEPEIPPPTTIQSTSDGADEARSGLKDLMVGLLKENASELCELKARARA